ncbi:MAG: cytidylate kinase [Acidimicrobiaceae bacterium TMED189]|nr:MAG: cytidylate kinase [Acidimicrobiaceae bacterium TMED189]|tara:strand:- start:410 stop:1024 length:615 start_codon:yes stop_codon:yes gene_type:complete
MDYLVTIDGPSGVGKTTLGSLLAKELNSNFFSSGKVYRNIAKYLNSNPSSDISDISLDINDELEITLNSISYQDIELYEKDVNSKSSEIAKLKEVRKLVSKSLQNLPKKLSSGLIVEGRDMGSVVFPNADLKIYLDADIDIRAQRRLKQSNDSETKEDLLQRDENDINRLESPLMIPENALYIDNSNMKMDEVVKLVIRSLEPL